MTPPRVYIAYDERACYGDTDDASVVEAFASEPGKREVTLGAVIRDIRETYDFKVVVFSYSDTDSILTDERFECVVEPRKGHK